MTRARAFAKINLALVVGPLRSDGRHEVATVLQRVDLHDDVQLEPADHVAVEGFEDDTLVGQALGALRQAAGGSPAWHARITKRIPVAAGLGGGSSDAATALRLANDTLERPLPAPELQRIAASLGADVSFFLVRGTQLATGAGSDLAPVALPTDYSVLLVLPRDVVKTSTGAVYRAFDERLGAEGFAGRASALRRALAGVREARDLDRLPPNDLMASTLVEGLVGEGAIRADVSGAGPVVYGLFSSESEAARAAVALDDAGRTWLARPVDGP